MAARAPAPFCGDTPFASTAPPPHRASDVICSQDESPESNCPMESKDSQAVAVLGLPVLPVRPSQFGRRILIAGQLIGNGGRLIVGAEVTLL